MTNLLPSIVAESTPPVRPRPHGIYFLEVTVTGLFSRLAALRWRMERFVRDLAPGTMTVRTRFSRIYRQGRLHGAVVMANGLPAVTDASGQVHFPAMRSCVTLDVTIAGYLDRRRCVAAPGQVTLWPLANADEGEVTRKWIFTRDQIHADFWSTPTLITLSPELAARPDVAATWKAATDAVTQLTRGVTWPDFDQIH